MTCMIRRLVAVVALVIGLGAAVGAPSATAQHSAPNASVGHTYVAPSDWWWE